MIQETNFYYDNTSEAQSPKVHSYVTVWLDNIDVITRWSVVAVSPSLAHWRPTVIYVTLYGGGSMNMVDDWR